MKVYVIIETDNEGVYQSSEVIADDDIANETLRRRRESFVYPPQVGETDLRWKEND